MQDSHGCDAPLMLRLVARPGAAGVLLAAGALAAAALLALAHRLEVPEEVTNMTKSNVWG